VERDVCMSAKYKVDFKTNRTFHFSPDNIGELHFILKSEFSNFVFLYILNTAKITWQFSVDDAIEQTANSYVNLARGTFASLYFKRYYF
jgi:hypothetical protein